MCNFQFFPYLCDNVPDVVADSRRCFSRVDRFPPPAKYFPFPAIDVELKLGASDFDGKNVTGFHMRMTRRVQVHAPRILLMLYRFRLPTRWFRSDERRVG